MNGKSNYIADKFRGSATALMLEDYHKALETIENHKVDKILDLGCGFGGVTKLVADFFSATEIYGVDIKPRRLEVAREQGIKTIEADLNISSLPLPSGYFDLVISNGVIEHLYFYDDLITESYRVLKRGGFLVLSLPNLANYIQRLSLLLGYQPSDVNISRKIYAGTLFCSGKPVQGHIHSATLNAVKQLLEYYNFTIIAARKGDPVMTGSRWAFLFKVVGYFCPISLTRRIIIIAQKPSPSQVNLRVYTPALGG